MARAFNGSSDTLATASVPTNATRYTISCWCFVRALTGAYQDVIFNGNTGSNGYGIVINPSNKWEILLGGLNEYASTITPSTTAWTHLLCLTDGSNVNRLYINGAIQVNSAVQAPNAPTGFMSLGANQTPAGFANVLMAEVGIWNIDLGSTDEIPQLARGQLPRKVRPSALKGYWPLWGLGSVEPDLSGNGVNFALTGTSQANHAPVDLFTAKSRTVFDIQVAPPVGGSGALLLSGIQGGSARILGG